MYGIYVHVHLPVALILHAVGIPAKKEMLGIPVHPKNDFGSEEKLHHVDGFAHCAGREDTVG